VIVAGLLRTRRMNLAAIHQLPASDAPRTLAMVHGATPLFREEGGHLVRS